MISSIFGRVGTFLSERIPGDGSRSESAGTANDDEDVIDWDDYNFLDKHEVPDGLSIEEHIFDKLENTIDKQFQLLNDIDNKAKSLAQYSAVLIGVVLTALSLIFRNGGVSLDTTPIMNISFLGMIFLFSAILQSIHTYLSSVIEYGISGEFAEDAVRRNMDEDWYLPLGIIAYSDAVKENIIVINTNAQRFRWAAFLLVVGLLFVFLSAYLFIFKPTFYVELGLFTVSLLAATWYFYYIYREEYLVVERQSTYNE